MSNSILSLSQFETRVHDVVFSAELCHIKSVDIPSKFDKIFEEVNSRTPGGRARYSRWMQGAVAGMVHYTRGMLWQNMEFCYRDDNGVIFSSEKDSIHRSTEEFYAVGRGCELADMEDAHLWRGTDKPFTEWKRSW